MPVGHQQRDPAAAGDRGRRNLVWLASYPKSGNTWLRMFLGNYFFDLGRPLPINQVHRLGVTDCATELYRKLVPTGFDPRDRTLALRLRPRMLDWVSGTGSDVIFVKSHAANARRQGVALVPPALTRAAVYILRDPRDVVISYARHFGTTLERAVEIAGEPGARIAANDTSVEQFTGSWSDHVAAWTRDAPFPVLVLRYEDMLADPHGAFSRALAHIGITADAEKLDRAVRFSAFSELERQEAAGDFLEHRLKADRFFHTGTAEQWRDGGLPDALVERVEHDHGAVMRQWGYLED